MDIFWIKLPVKWPHAFKKIGGLLGRIVQKLWNDFNFFKRPDKCHNSDDVESRAAYSLRWTEALPMFLIDKL